MIYIIERIRILFKPRNKNILFELIRAKVKVSDHSSILGVFWSLIGPLLPFAAMYMIFRERFGQEITAYPLYIFIGVVCVNFFMISTASLLKIFSGYRDILLNSTVPVECLFLSELFIQLYKFLIEFSLCLILSSVLHLFSLKLLILIFPLLLAFIGFVLGISIILAVSFCFLKDIDHIWMIISRIFYFVTPIFYPMGSISKLAQKTIYIVNPLTPFVLSFRSILINTEVFNINTYLLSLTWGVAAFVFGYLILLKFEHIAIEKS